MKTETNNKDSKVSYTKGEWSFKTPKAINDEGELKHLISIYASDGTHICDKKIISKCLPQAEANAKLIAAAPALLENLIRIIDRIEEGGFEVNFPSAYNRAKQAIKKATEQ